MSISFNQLRQLVGRLDDQPGFDSPRERFRRFLTEDVVDLHVAAALVDEGQHALGEQAHRGLQDVLVILGRFLGFETAFGTYQRAAGTARHHGLWRSRRRLTVILDLFTDQTPRSDFDDLSKELAALAREARLDTEAETLGLCIVTPLFPWRQRLEAMLAAQMDAADRRVVTAGSLLSLAALVAEGEIRHEEIVQLLTNTSDVDLIAGLLARTRRAAPLAPADDAPAADAAAPRDAASWVVTSARGHAAAFERIVESVVGQRRVLGVAENRNASTFAHAGDRMCFLVPGKGVVGGAEIAGAASTARRLIRDSDRFSRLYQLKNVELFGGPRPRDVELEDRLAKDYDEAQVAGPTLIPVSDHTYAALTGSRDRTEESAPDGAATRDVVEPISRGSRSRE
jgi:hypothetical protein